MAGVTWEEEDTALMGLRKSQVGSGGGKRERSETEGVNKKSARGGCSVPQGRWDST